MNICSIFLHGRHGYRSTAFYKVSIVYKERTLLNELPFMFYNIQSCIASEAHFVGGAGIGGCIALIKDCIHIGEVPWSATMIAEAKESARCRIDRDGDFASSTFDPKHRKEFYLEYINSLKLSDKILHNVVMKLTSKYHRLHNLHYHHLRQRNKRLWKKYSNECLKIELKLYVAESRLRTSRIKT